MGYKNELLDELVELVESSGDTGCSIWNSEKYEYRFYEIINILKGE